MKARVKADSKFEQVTSMGVLFDRFEWQAVPEGFEGKAKAHPELETQGKPIAEEKATKAAEAEAALEARFTGLEIRIAKLEGKLKGKEKKE